MWPNRECHLRYGFVFITEDSDMSLKLVLLNRLDIFREIYELFADVIFIKYGYN